MAYFADLYTDISKRFKDWTAGDRANEGGNVTDVCLDYANRAQQKLWQYKNWEYLLKEVPLTLNASLTATLPIDFGKVVLLGVDNDGDGKIDSQYFNNALRWNGYKIRNTFSKVTGNAFTVQFYQSPTGTAILYYQKILEDFAGTGTEYSYFPANLLLLQMQDMYLTEGGNPDTNLSFELRKEIRDYEQANQWVNPEMVLRQNDRYGRPLLNQNYSLSGGASRSENSNGYRDIPSRDTGVY